MSELMVALEFVRTYLDDLLCITKASLGHLDYLRLVLTRLREVGLNHNHKKYRRYSQLQRRNQSKTSVASWAWSSIIEIFGQGVVCLPLTSLVGECGHLKSPEPINSEPRYKQENGHGYYCKRCSAGLPRLSQEFEIYTDASSKQLGAVITQGNKSRKLTATQQRYSVTKIELLDIVETPKEFKGMLWGQRLTVFSDHKNLIQEPVGLTSDGVYRWRLLLEEYGPEVIHIKGIQNTVADAISRLDICPVQEEKTTWMTFTKPGAITPCMLLQRRAQQINKTK
eukprot:CCRYP_011269-RB/>CCRYP_011269-RB protein AED:0.46 eAED:0.43 QI:0/0/0/1/0/0/3/0/281